MSSKINLQPCEYARKSSIFQDNQLILDKIETKEMNETIRYIYQERKFEANQFEILYTAALKRLYKEGMLIKNVDNGLNYYKLSKKGYYTVKDLLNDVMVDNRDKLVNRIRLDIISAQYR